MKKLIVLLLLFLTLCPTTQAQQDTSQVITFLTYGSGIPYKYRNPQITISRQWGIRHKHIAGCMVSYQLKDSVKQHNKKTEVLAEAKFGKGWRKRYKEAVREEMQYQKQVHKLLDADLNIARLKKGESWRNLYLMPQTPKTVYLIKVFGWGKWQGKDAIVCWAKLQVNLKTNTVMVLNEQTTAFDKSLYY